MPKSSRPLFAAKLDELGNDGKAPFDLPEAIARAEVGRDCKPATADGNANFDGEPIPPSEKPKHARKLNGNRVPRRGAARRNASIAGATSQPHAQSVTPLGKELRLRDRDHLKFVRAQPSPASGRGPSYAH